MLFRLKSSTLILFAIPLSLVGFYVLLLSYMVLSGSSSDSRSATIPFRLLTTLLFGGSIFVSKKLFFSQTTGLFLFFSSAYLMRILSSFSDDNSSLYQSPESFLFYFLSFSLIPFLSVSLVSIDESVFKRIFLYLVACAVFISIQCIFVYGKYIGIVGRISQIRYLEGTDFLSPLALSYISALAITSIFIYCSSVKLSTPLLLILRLSALICLVPFFLGASRGAVNAVILVVLIYFFSLSKSIDFYKLIITTIFSISALFFAQNLLGNAVFNRYSSILSDIQSGDSSAIRLTMWADALFQFWESPVYGSSLQLSSFQVYPHNSLLEVLISTGLVGFIFYSAFIASVSYKAFQLLRSRSSSSWVAAVFITGFASDMVSGSISASIMTSVGSGLVISACRLNKIATPA